MGYRITSTINMETRGCTMKHKRRVMKNPDDHQEKPAQEQPHSHHYKSQAMSDKNRLFHHVKGKQNGVTQNVTVDVKVEQPADNCVTGCFAAIGKMFRGS